jgi:hypothetical protein
MKGPRVRFKWEAMRVEETWGADRPIYEATATRNGRWWVIAVPQLGIATRVRSFGNAVDQVRNLVALWTECKADSFDVSVVTAPPK